MNPCEVQDDDESVSVMAEIWMNAVEAWKEQFENELTPECGDSEPSGVSLVAENSDAGGLHNKEEN